MSTHDHIADCCPTEGPWCTRKNIIGDSSVWYALDNKYPESQCISGLYQIIGTITDNGILFGEAAYYGYVEFMRILLANGLDINITDDTGLTALHGAVVCSRMKSTRFLIEHGANINALDAHNYTPIMYCGNREIYKYLLDNGADVHIVQQRGSRNEILSLLVAYGYPIIDLIHDLPLYLRDAADGAFSRRKAAIRWWFYRHP
jgi:hypothetical protein